MVKQYRQQHGLGQCVTSSRSGGAAIPRRPMPSVWSIFIANRTAAVTMAILEQHRPTEHPQADPDPTLAHLAGRAVIDDFLEALSHRRLAEPRGQLIFSTTFSFLSSCGSAAP